MLKFIEENHQYLWNEKPVPNVTEILRATGQAKDWKDVPEFYRDRGTAVHRAVALWLAGTLDDSTVDEVVRPYLEQFKEWLGGKARISGLSLSETPLYSQEFGFAGTLDVVINEKIYDLKCSKKLDRESEWQYSLQGSGYRTLIRENFETDLPFEVLLLTGQGPAQAIPLSAPYTGWAYVMGLYKLKTNGRGT